MRRRLPTLLYLLLPFLLPLGVLLVWMIGQCNGQMNEPQRIVASIDASGTGTTYLSTVVDDGSDARWSCSAGTFKETGTTQAYGRSVTWCPSESIEDSVTVIMRTGSVSDSVVFLPAIRPLLPTATVSAAYHLATVDRCSFVSVPPGRFRVVAEADNLTGYDGLTVLITSTPASSRRAYVVYPGDTLFMDFPLGAEIRAVAMESLEDALDNGGSVIVRFEETSGSEPDST
ncbi:hypothetical protein GF402_05675 [Candidatus Fermentibacteria bacterium]|nr:hypothetical protein [Candidatus Fermentibacteria bacterium]